MYLFLSYFIFRKVRNANKPTKIMLKNPEKGQKQRHCTSVVLIACQLAMDESLIIAVSKL